jgi:hypothetical protein
MRSPDQLIDTREPGIELAVVNGTGLIIYSESAS